MMPFELLLPTKATRDLKAWMQIWIRRRTHQAPSHYRVTCKVFAQLHTTTGPQAAALLDRGGVEIAALQL